MSPRPAKILGIVFFFKESVGEYMRREETRESGLLDLETSYKYHPPEPKSWKVVLRIYQVFALPYE